MFEKEAEEKLSEEEYKLAEEVIKPIYYNAIKNDYSFAKYGVECYLAGYNKANEWQYPSKGELPDNDNDILCQIDFETFEVGYFNEMYNNFFTIYGKEINVKAWKEIVLPKESE